MSKSHYTVKSARILGRILGAACAVAMVLCSSSTSADVVYETTPPGGFLGFWGADVFDGQSVAVRFTPNANFTLDRAKVWFMNNDFDGGHPPVTLSLRTEAPNGIPSGTIMEQWEFNVSAVGWDPVLEVLNSAAHPALQSGVNYWLVAQSDAQGGLDGVWVMAGESTGYTAYCNGIPCEWSGGKGAVEGTIVEGTPALPHCIGDVTPAPSGDQVVNIDDLVTVITHWGATGTPGSVLGDVNSNGVVNIDDLVALITHWGACP